MSSNFLTANSTATYIRNITVGKMINKHKGVLSLPKKLSKDGPVASALGITHLDDASLYT